VNALFDLLNLPDSEKETVPLTVSLPVNVGADSRVNASVVIPADVTLKPEEYIVAFEMQMPLAHRGRTRPPSAHRYFRLNVMRVTLQSSPDAYRYAV
jgi:hypothetical protein